MTEKLFQEANAESSGDALLTLVTISHSTLVTPIRCVLNEEDIDSRTHTFRAYPFEFVPPELTREGMRPGHLRIGNIDGVIVQTLRAVAGGGEEPVVTFEFIYASAPDTVERVWPLLILQNARYDDVVEGDVTLPDLTTEPFPGWSFIPRNNPGLVY